MGVSNRQKLILKGKIRNTFIVHILTLRGKKLIA